MPWFCSSEVPAMLWMWLPRIFIPLPCPEMPAALSVAETVPVLRGRVAVDAVVLQLRGARDVVDVVAQDLHPVAVPRDARCVERRRASRHPRPELVVDHPPRPGAVLEVDRRGVAVGPAADVHPQVRDRPVLPRGPGDGRPRPGNAPAGSRRSRVVHVLDRVAVDRPRIRLSLIHISEPTRLLSISYAVFC